MKLLFLSLASGSSGNCYYLGTSRYGILIDAGISIRSIKKRLNEKGVDLEQVIAVLVTHDHTDHIKTVGCLCEKYHIPVYSTQLVHDGIERSRFVESTLYQSRKTIEKCVPFMLRDLKIEAFGIPHDSTDNVGYMIEYGNVRFTIATDCGYVSETVSKYLCKSSHFVLEANYDNEMLMTGRYPDFLKERVAGMQGHLSNHDAANFLATHYSHEWKKVWLCHLSRENNHPELVYKTIDLRLSQKGLDIDKDLEVVILKRTTPSELFELE